MLAFSSDHAIGKTNIAVPGFLVEVALLSSFEAAGSLIYHVLNGAYVFEVETVAADAIDAYVANHQHPKLAFALGLGSHQPCKHFRLFRVCFNYGHR